MLWLLLLLNEAMLLAATVPLAETLDAVADAKRGEVAAARERAAGLGMVRWPLGRLGRTKWERLRYVSRSNGRRSGPSRKGHLDLATSRGAENYPR